MGDLLQDQYTSVFSNPAHDSINPAEFFADDDTGNGLNDITFSILDIIKAINELSNTAAAGPDGISAFFLKQCKESIACPLYLLYRESLDGGDLYIEGKRSTVIPLHKGGNLGLPANYRPISLTSHLVKILEKIIRRQIVKFLEECNLFNNSQHGFRAGSSVTGVSQEYIGREQC